MKRRFIHFCTTNCACCNNGWLLTGQRWVSVLGAQLMARALGRGCTLAGWEIGWKPLTLTEAGWASPVAALAAEHTSMLHWHGDTFDLPEGARLLASTDICQQQIFAWGATRWGSSATRRRWASI